MFKTQNCYTQTLHHTGYHIRLVKHTDMSLSVAVVARDDPDELAEMLTVRIFYAGGIPISS